MKRVEFYSRPYRELNISIHNGFKGFIYLGIGDHEKKYLVVDHDRKATFHISLNDRIDGDNTVSIQVDPENAPLPKDLVSVLEEGGYKKSRSWVEGERNKPKKQTA